MTNMWRHNGMFDVVAYFVLSPNVKESFNKFLSLDPDLDHRRRGPSHGDNTSCVQNKSIGAIVFELRVRTDRQTQMHYPRSRSCEYHIINWVCLVCVARSYDPWVVAHVPDASISWEPTERPVSGPDRWHDGHWRRHVCHAADSHDRRRHRPHRSVQLGCQARTNWGRSTVQTDPQILLNVLEFYLSTHECSWKRNFYV